MNIVSLFPACDGLDLGFERAGFKVIWANEFDDSIHETYRLNHPDTILNTSDIRNITGADVPECDGIIGGHPCQSWSEGGNRVVLMTLADNYFWIIYVLSRKKRPEFLSLRM